MSPRQTEPDGEILELRSPTTKTYLIDTLPDGREVRKAVVSQKRVHWGPSNEFTIDPVWVKQNGTYVATGVPYAIEVGPGIAWIFTLDDKTISGSMTIPGAGRVPEPIIDGVQLWWIGAAPDFDVCLLLHAEHAEAFYVLNSANAPRTFSVEFTHDADLGAKYGHGGMDRMG